MKKVFLILAAVFCFGLSANAGKDGGSCRLPGDDAYIEANVTGSNALTVVNGSEKTVASVHIKVTVSRNGFPDKVIPLTVYGIEPYGTKPVAVDNIPANYEISDVSVSNPVCK
ncbi:MAG: hypothetical protein LBN27_05485 [Prevotellaceae bacterium]|jgi:hypothetical protein|nr:hypothetical protein [Prevotellaceae bacterium]